MLVCPRATAESDTGFAGTEGILFWGLPCHAVSHAEEVRRESICGFETATERDTASNLLRRRIDYFHSQADVGSLPEGRQWA
jgi:hypothetical protein